jgi:DNA-binding SARP family transcriptional activator/tetratricopeptide (TPR) repeat protein
MERLKVRLFGGVEARVGVGPPLRLPTRKTLALFAFLAAHLGEPQGRDKLAGLLWGGSSDQQARQSLRQALYWIRRAAAEAGGPPEIFGESEGVLIDAAAAEVDAVDFERLIAAGDGAAQDQAIGLYRGDFLDGLAAEDPAFEDWLRAERERRRELALETLARCVARHERAGALDMATQFAGRWLALDPLQEAAHRALMRLYSRGGRRAAALRQYQLCADTIRRELGTDPEPETRTLYQELLRHGAENSGGGAARNGRPSPIAAPAAPLVGRHAELVQLREALQAAAPGRLQAVAVSGEAGVGKTRLIGELVGEARAGRARVLIGHAREMEQDLPFAPVIDALRGASDDMAALGDLDPVLQAHLQRLLPELWQSDATPAAAEDRPQALFEAIARWLERLAADAPLVLALEDVHWADDGTIRLLSFLAHRLEALPLLVLLSLREEELPEDAALKALLRELEIARRLTTIGLSRLGSTATSALVRTLGRQRLARSTLARLVPRVWRQSEGNPFMIVELVHAALEAGSGRRAPPGSLPERVQALIGGRLERLSGNGRRMVEVAAVIGSAFEFDLAQRASTLAPDAAAEALDELVRRRVLVAGEDGLGFSHDQIRAAAYGRLLPARRQVLHRAVAEAMEALATDRSADTDDRLAYHFARAGDIDLATSYLLRAAGTARHQYALDVTLKLLDAALQHIESSTAVTRERRRLEVMLRKAQILSIFGRFKEVFELLLPYRPRLEAMADPALAGPYYVRLALTFAQVGSHRQAEAEARRAIESANRCDDDGVRGHAYYVLGVRGWFSGDTRAGAAHAGEGARLFEAAGPLGMAGLAYWILGLNLQLRGEFGAALAAGARAAEIAAALGEPALGSRAAWTMGLVELTRGEADLAIAHADRALDQAISHPANRATALAVRGRARIDRGELDAAVADLEAAVSSLSPFDVARAITAIHLAEARLARGEHAAAQAAATTARELATARECPWAVAAARRAMAAILLAQGEHDAAQGELDAALDSFERQEMRFETARTRMDLAEVLRAQGRAAEAAAQVASALQLLEALEAPVALERARRLARSLQQAPAVS